jgi:hypothetical protein
MNSTDPRNDSTTASTAVYECTCPEGCRCDHDNQ